MPPRPWHNGRGGRNRGGQKMTLHYISLFSGIEAFSVAAFRLGMIKEVA